MSQIVISWYRKKDVGMIDTDTGTGIGTGT